MINDNCGTTESTKNTGSDKQCLVKPTVGYALAKSTQSFADAVAFRSKTAWDAAKKSKDIAVLYLIDKSELANVEATYYEGRIKRIKTKEARKGIRFTHLLGYCSHSALASFEESEYTHIYEFAEDGSVKGVVQADGSIKGQEMSNFLVGPVNEPVIEGDPQNSVVEIVYADPNELSDNSAVIKPNFNVLKYKGIYPANLTVVGTPTATGLVVRATYGCDGKPLTGLEITDFEFTGSTPNSVTDGTGADANLYTFVGTGLVSGTIATKVVEQTLAMFETDDAVTFTIA